MNPACTGDWTRIMRRFVAVDPLKIAGYPRTLSTRSLCERLIRYVRATQCAHWIWMDCRHCAHAVICKCACAVPPRAPIGRRLLCSRAAAATRSRLGHALRLTASMAAVQLHSLAGSLSCMRGPQRYSVAHLLRRRGQRMAGSKPCCSGHFARSPAASTP
jgi:hypothetical protein